MTNIKIYDVGGFVRDELLGISSKDRDCTVVLDGPLGQLLTVEQGFDEMRRYLVENGFEIFVESPEYATIRAHPPERDGLTADFVLARKEGPYSDGRRPDWVELGTLEDDLNRRDFTINAMARDLESGELIDLHGGQIDLKMNLLRFVGDPTERIVEDALRIMRALRFCVTKNLQLDAEAYWAIRGYEAAEKLAEISEERREQELKTMFKGAPSHKVIQLLSGLPSFTQEAIFAGRVRLTATLKS